MKRKEHHKFGYLIAAALWGAMIFYLSSIPDLASSLPSDFDFVLRKMAHMFVFAVLAYLLAASLEKDSRPYIFFAILVSVAYAFTDELHQSGVEGRHGAATDILVDTWGVFVGIWLYQHYPPKIIKKKFLNQFR